MNRRVTEPDVASLIRQRREAKGLSQPELAKRVGTSQQTIDKIEKGLIKHSSYLGAIGAELGIGLSQLLRPPPNEGVEIAAANPLVGNTDLPLYGAAVAIDGVVTLSTGPVDFIPRPAPLARVRDAYGVLVPDDTMAPEFFTGNIALVHPHLPATIGTTCVFYPNEAGGGSAFVIRHLRRVTVDGWHVTLWNAGKTETAVLRRADWRVCHVTVGRYSYR